MAAQINIHSNFARSSIYRSEQYSIRYIIWRSWITQPSSFAAIHAASHEGQAYLFFLWGLSEIQIIRCEIAFHLYKKEKKAKISATILQDQSRLCLGISDMV